MLGFLIFKVNSKIRIINEVLKLKFVKCLMICEKDNINIILRNTKNIKVLMFNNIRIVLTKMNNISYLWRVKHESSCNNGVKVRLS